MVEMLMGSFILADLWVWLGSRLCLTEDLVSSGVLKFI